MKIINFYPKAFIFLCITLTSIFSQAKENKNETKNKAKEYTLYYNNGNIQEQGFWLNGKNLGEFVRYYENGVKSQEFYFDENGNRSGEQNYYYENGQLRMTGIWEKGKESGDITLYNEDGSVKRIKKFDSGELTMIIDENNFEDNNVYSVSK